MSDVQGSAGPSAAPPTERAAHIEIDASMAVEAPPADGSESPRSPRRIIRGLLRNPASLFGTVVLAAFTFISVAAPILAPCPEDPRQQRRCGESAYNVPQYGYGSDPQPPSAEHPFGLTTSQHDIFYGVVWGTRTAFKVGLFIVASALVIGVSVGAIASYYGGWVDEVLMRIVEIFQAFPYFLAATALATILRSNPKLQGSVIPAMAALIAFGWMGYARLLRADILTIRERDYVWAARSQGASDFQIVTRHVLPNAIFPVMVLASLNVGTIVLSFAALAFFALGVPEGYADWGQMISSARNRIPTLVDDWYLVVYPGLAIVFFSLSWNLIGDALRDLLDPRLAKR